LAKAYLCEQRRAATPALRRAINDVEDLVELYEAVAELPSLDLSLQLRLPRVLCPELERLRSASKSKVTASGAPPAAHTAARALARAMSMPRSSTEATACTARQAVAWEATGPNSASWSRSAASLDKAVGAIGDGHGQMGEHDAGVMGGHRHRRCQPRAIGQLGQQGLPECDTRPSPSVVTFICRTD